MSLKSNLSGVINKESWTKLLKSLRYALYVITHPFDGFWDLTHEKRGSLGAANVLVVAFFMTQLWSMRFTNFMFMDVLWEKINIWQQILGNLAPILIYCAANWCLTTLFDGKGRFVDIYIGTAYALTPYILVRNIVTILSNFVTEDEGAFITYVDYISLFLCVFLILVSVIQVHDYGLGMAIFAILASALGCMIIVFLLLLFFTLLSDAVSYFISIYKEIAFRLY